MNPDAREVRAFAWRTGAAVVSIVLAVVIQWSELFMGVVAAVRVPSTADFAALMSHAIGGAVSIDIAVCFCAGLFFLVWVHRAVTNTRALAPAAGLDTPSEVLIMWMIPLVNLVVPYRYVKTICRVAAGAGDRKGIEDDGRGVEWPRRWVCPFGGEAFGRGGSLRGCTAVARPLCSGLACTLGSVQL